jgi:hypothetical protein
MAPPAAGCVNSQRTPTDGRCNVTLVWFVVWLVANNIGDHEPLLFDPVNWWTGLLLLTLALDLSAHHAASATRSA